MSMAVNLATGSLMTRETTSDQVQLPQVPIAAGRHPDSPKSLECRISSNQNPACMNPGKMHSNKLELYARGRNNLWTDPHIAKQMLSAHLDPSHDAATRNADAIAETIDWIDSVSEGKRQLIDLGCGPGIYANAFYDRGYRVTGVDISANSINHAVAQAKRSNKAIRYQVGNYIEEPLEGIHNLAICIYCDFGALIPPEQEAFLANVRSILDEDGILILDVFGTGLSLAMEETRNWTLHPEPGFWSPLPHLELAESAHFPDAMAWGRRTLIIEEGSTACKEFITWDSYFTEGKIGRILEAAGFALELIKTGLIQSNSFTSDAVMFVKARKT
jgi:SAM-dependent methyltransferase